MNQSSLVNMHYTSALTIKENKAFKNKNGVTMVRALKMKLGGHHGCGLRHVPVSLTT